MVTDREMRLVQESSKQIANIIGSINAITEKNYLLALNAAIEAARAGESGRGFAVMADEVRKLTQQSAVSATEITQLVNESTGRIAQCAAVFLDAHEAYQASDRVQIALYCGVQPMYCSRHAASAIYTPAV